MQSAIFHDFIKFTVFVCFRFLSIVRFSQIRDLYRFRRFGSILPFLSISQNLSTSSILCIDFVRFWSILYNSVDFVRQFDHFCRNSRSFLSTLSISVNLFNFRRFCPLLVNFVQFFTISFNFRRFYTFLLIFIILSAFDQFCRLRA